MEPVQLAAVLAVVVLAASMVSVELGFTVALLELTLGVVAGNLLNLESQECWTSSPPSPRSSSPSWRGWRSTRLTCAGASKPPSHRRVRAVVAGHGHSPGLVDPSIVRSRAGVEAVALSLLVLGLTAAAQAAIFILSDSVALLADLIHNVGDALTALPLGAAFFLRSALAERWAGLFAVLAIVVSCVGPSTRRPCG